MQIFGKKLSKRARLVAAVVPALAALSAVLLSGCGKAALEEGGKNPLTFEKILGKIDDFVWGVPLIVLILAVGLLLTVRTKLTQVFHLGKALRYMFNNEEGEEGDVTSFGALCTALSATIGTGNIVGVATAVCAGGPGALFWMEVAAFLGMATKYAEGLLAVKYRTVDSDGRILGGPFYYIENGMGKGFKWLAVLFAIFGLRRTYGHWNHNSDKRHNLVR